MSILLHNWKQTVNGQDVTVDNGALYLDDVLVGSVQDHPVNGFVVKLADYQTIDVPDLQTAAKAVTRHMAVSTFDEAL